MVWWINIAENSQPSWTIDMVSIILIFRYHLNRSSPHEFSRKFESQITERTSAPKTSCTWGYHRCTYFEHLKVGHQCDAASQIKITRLLIKQQKVTEKSIIRGVQNFSAKSLRRRIYHVMAYARNQNFSAFSNHLIFPHFLSETTVTWQIKILVQSQFQNFSAFSNNCDLTCPKLISHDSLMTHLFFFLLVYNYES